MSVALSVALGAVFVIAGAAKLIAGPSWREQASGLGAPQGVAVALPWIEIALGSLAIAQLARRWVALAAGALLVGFTIAIVRQLRRGQRPPCACFGAWSTAPISGRDVVRNAALMALAAAIVIIG